MRIFGSSFSILPSVFTDNFGHGNFIFLKQKSYPFSDRNDDVSDYATPPQLFRFPKKKG